MTEREPRPNRLNWYLDKIAMYPWAAKWGLKTRHKFAKAAIDVEDYILGNYRPYAAQKLMILVEQGVCEEAFRDKPKGCE